MYVRYNTLLGYHNLFNLTMFDLIFKICTYHMYARANFEDSALFEVMKINFEPWTKENWETIDATTWMIIKQL